MLRCGALPLEPQPRLPLPTKNVVDPRQEEDGKDNSNSPSVPSFWLVLDEVVDPQNLGALLRSAYFLGYPRIGILVCAKNSAPPSPVVSAASAGALELLTVHSTNNLPRTLNQARDDGFRIIGASSSIPFRKKKEQATSDDEDDDDEGYEGEERKEDHDDDAPSPVYNLHDLPLTDPHQPTLLVLGSEGHGLRKLVARACTEFVRIPSGEAMWSLHPHDSDSPTTDIGVDKNRVDSLNVSVTGGILLWHLLGGRS